MPDQDSNQDSVKRTLSEISHLFLSDVRDRQTGGAPRPMRVPPGQRPATPAAGPTLRQESVDEEAEGPNSGLVISGEPAHPEHDLPPAPPVTALIAAHLGGGQSVEVRRYARNLAARLGRVGLIEIEDTELRISCFEPAPNQSKASPSDAGIEGLNFDDAPLPESQTDDPRTLAESIEELNWDVSLWLLAPCTLRQAKVRSLLGEVTHWVLLSTCDHDGVVSSYRTIKGLAETVPDGKPTLTLSLLDAGGQPEMARVFAKLSGVCQQFLDWPVEPEPEVVPVHGVIENAVLVYRDADPAADDCESWSVLTDLVSRADSAEAGSVAPGSHPRPERPASPTLNSAAFEAGSPAAPLQDSANSSTAKPRRIAPAPTITPAPRGAEPFVNLAAARPPVAMAESIRPVAPVEAPAVDEQTRPEPLRAPDAANPVTNGFRISPQPVIPAQTEPGPARPGPSEVLEISADATAESILTAILSRAESGLVECPVRTPMCPSARLTIDRDRRVILLAVAREGLAELRSIGQAYRWLIENRALIGMAVPQLAIDALQFPRLRLLVDPADASADALQPMLQSGHVSVQAYRRLRWGNRTGLLLDAA